MLVAGPIAGWLSGRRGSKLPLLLGTGFAGALLPAPGGGALARSGRSLLAVTLLGLGIGLSFASMANLIVEAVPQHQTGEATGMNTIMRTVGGAFGGQIAAAIVADHIDAGTGLAAESGFTAAFALGRGRARGRARCRHPDPGAACHRGRGCCARLRSRRRLSQRRCTSPEPGRSPVARARPWS